MGGTQVQLESAKTVTSEQGQLTSVQNLTREELLANLWVAGNVFLDNVLAFAEPTDLPPASAPPADQPPPPPPVAGAAPDDCGRRDRRPGAVPAQWRCRRQPAERRGGRRSGLPRLRVHSRRDAERPVRRWCRSARCRATVGATSRGASPSPVGTNPGQHLLTVRGSGCELNTVITVAGAQATRALVFTGSSNHTLTYVLAGFAAVHVRRRARLRNASSACVQSPGSGPPSV